MVSVNIVSKYKDDFPGVDSPDRKIGGGPLYGEDEVLPLLKDKLGGKIVLSTRKCIEDVQSRDLEHPEICELLREATTQGIYKGSEWCELKSGGPWVAADAYSLDRREWIEVARKEMLVNYFFKFAISEAGDLILLVSCHP